MAVFRIVRSYQWPTQTLAYEMERQVLLTLSPHRTVDERAVCQEEEIERAWQGSIHQRPPRLLGLAFTAR